MAAVAVLAGSFFSIVTIYFFYNAQNAAISATENSLESAVTDIHDFLDEGGRREIRRAADQFIAHIETYLQTHPDATVDSMLHDEDLEAYRKQAHVGSTGYITIMEADNLLFIGHPNKSFVGKPFDDIPVLKEPRFADITRIVHDFRDTQGHVEGYYTWIEPDGRVTQKFLSYSISTSTTKDGKRIGVNASTYLDEFNFSIQESSRLFRRSVSELRASFAQDFGGFLKVLGILSLSAVTALAVVSYIDYLHKGKRRNKIAQK